MDTWTERLLKMLVAPACIAVVGLLLALALHRLAAWLDTPALLQYAGPLFQASLALALAMSIRGYGRLRWGWGAAARPVLRLI